jgi:GTP diphosphokinase / guanosine-3',5'-bis(diphosphate) 3'-diphosphatase
VNLANIDAAILFATQAHYGQVDKAGKPYILHPLRVGARLFQFGPEYVIAGLLHDVVEDTEYELADLERAGATPAILAAVASVTKITSEKEWVDYRVSLDRAMTNEIGGWVKASDVADNYSRLSLIPDVEVQTRLAEKYAKALKYLDDGGFSPYRFLNSED